MKLLGKILLLMLALALVLVACTPKSEHSAKSDWLSDAENHWHECADDGCSEKLDMAAHTPGMEVKSDGVTEWYECTVCGARVNEVALGETHIHDYSKTWVTENGKHWMECSCGARRSEGTCTAGDELKYNEDYTSQWNECTVCGTKMNEADHIHAGDEWQEGDGKLWKVCASCSQKFDEISVDDTNSENYYTVITGAGNVTLNGAAIFGEGVTVASINNGGTLTQGNTINLPAGEHILVAIASNGESRIVKVIAATKFITSLEDLKETFTGTTMSGGYYVLGNNIDANGATVGAANKGWNQNEGLCGGAVFNGCGHTISNITVTSAYGIFGTLGNCTVKDVNFKGVTLNGGTTLLAYNAYNADILNVNVEYIGIGSTAGGLLIAGQTGTGSNFQNITLNAAGIVVPNALGNKVNLSNDESGVVFENVKILAKAVTKIGTGGNGPDVTSEITYWPKGITFTVKDVVGAEVADELIAENGSVTLVHDWFKQGETVKVNGTTYAIATNGQLALTDLTLDLGEKNTILCITNSGRVNFTNVLAVTKVLYTADDLDMLNAHSESVHGYYILGGNIDATAKIISNTAYSWSAGFFGTLDGRGYAIDGLTVSGHGLFTRITGGTVKNLNFTNVNLNGGALFASIVASDMHICDVTVDITSLTANTGSYNGILISREIGAAMSSEIKNMTVNVVRGTNVPNVFGQIKTTLLTFENVVINATTLDKLATDSAGADTTQIEGVTCNLATVTAVSDELILDLSVVGATFTHESFAVGTEYTISINGSTYTATAVDGSVTFDLSGAGLEAGNVYTAMVMDDSTIVSYSNIFAVTKVISSAADLTALSHDNAPANTGYYILTGNVDCTGTTFNSGTSWSNGFAGTLDGRGYSVSNFTVSSWGIFGRVENATIKNITFDNVTFSGATALLGRMSAGNTVIDKVTVNVVAHDAAVADETGIFFGRETPAATAITNTAINLADGVKVYKLLGNTFTSGTVSITVSVEYADNITYIYGTSTTAPTGVTVTARKIPAVIIEVTDPFFGENGGNATLKHEAFTLGASVVCNGTAYTVATEGQITVPVSGTVAQTTTIICELDGTTLKFTNVLVVTKIISSAADLTALSHDNAPADAGYYILTGNVDCNGATFNSSTSWNNGFAGTLDGRGYTISNFTVSSWGIFGRVAAGTIQNITFDEVTFNGATALFGRMSAGSTVIDNVTVNVAANTATVADETGIFFGRETPALTKITNTTINLADGVKVYKLLGNTFTSGTVSIMVSVEYADNITYIYGTSTTAPTGVTVTARKIPAVIIEVTDPFFGENGGNATLKHEAFTLGASVVCNGTAYTVATEGQITVPVSGTVAQTTTIICELDGTTLKFTNVFVVTKILKTVDDLKTLNYNASVLHEGYYVLTADIDCAGATFGISGKGWSANAGFAGTIDGNGFAIKNFTMSGYNVTWFGNLSGGTVKNIDFEDVTIGSGAAIVACMAYSGTIENVNVTLAAFPQTAESENGVFISRQTTAITYKNVTIDANGLNITNLFGCEIKNAPVCENFVINNVGDVVLGYTGTNSSSTEYTTMPAGLTINKKAEQEVLESTNFAAAEDGAATITLTHESFTSGAAVSVTWNGVTQSVTADEGTLTLTLADFNVTALGQSQVVTETDTHILTFTEVWNVTKVLTSKSDLTQLCTWTDTKNTGYYILNGDIACGWGASLNTSTIGAWSANSGFKGTFDGRGYTISQFNVGGFGLFGSIGTDAVVKNINFTSCTVDNSGVFFARLIYGGTFENITVTINQYNNTTYPQLGFFGAEGVQNSTWRNITVNANGQALGTIVGASHAASNTYENVVFNNVGSYAAYGYSGGNFYTAGTTAIAKPDGITVNLVAAAAEELTVETFAAAEDGATTVTLTHESFTSGAAVSVTWNGVTQSVTADAGTLTLTLADFNVTALGQSQVVTETDTHILTFTEVWNVTKVLSTKADLTLLCTWTDTKNTGYYILNGDIACGWGTSLNTSTIGAWSANSGFKGTFDGRGYTISQFNVGGFGLFGSIGSGAVVKNINFTSCTVDNSGVFFARLIYGGTYENITIKINQYNNTSKNYLGFFASEGTQASTWTDITVDANGADIGSIVGVSYKATNNTYTNVVFNNVGSYTAYGYTDGAYYTAPATDGSTEITCPSGITVNLVN